MCRPITHDDDVKYDDMMFDDIKYDVLYDDIFMYDHVILVVFDDVMNNY